MLSNYSFPLESSVHPSIIELRGPDLAIVAQPAAPDLGQHGKSQLAQCTKSAVNTRVQAVFLANRQICPDYIWDLLVQTAACCCSPEIPRSLRDTCSTPAPKQAEVVCAVACGNCRDDEAAATAATAKCCTSLWSCMPRLLYQRHVSTRYMLVRLRAALRCCCCCYRRCRTSDNWHWQQFKSCCIFSPQLIETEPAHQSSKWVTQLRVEQAPPLKSPTAECTISQACKIALSATSVCYMVR